MPGRIPPNRSGRSQIAFVAFGFTNPLLVSERGELIAGHGRYKAAELLGLVKVPVIAIAGLSPARQRALAIAAIGRLDHRNLGLATPSYEPQTHYQQVRDVWHGLRTPAGQ